MAWALTFVFAGGDLRTGESTQESRRFSVVVGVFQEHSPERRDAGAFLHPGVVRTFRSAVPGQA